MWGVGGVGVGENGRDSSTGKGHPKRKATAVHKQLDGGTRKDESVGKEWGGRAGGKVIRGGEGGGGERWCAIFEQDATECRKQWCLKHHDSTL